MPGWPPSTQFGGRHDRVVSPPRMAEATTTGRTWSRASELRPSARALLSFQGPLRVRAEGNSRADAIRPEGDQRVYRPAPVCRASSARSGHTQAFVAAFTDLEHLTVKLGRGDVEPSCLQHPAANPDSPLIDQPTGLAARKVEVLGQ
jgi:hypothetical protein